MPNCLFVTSAKAWEELSSTPKVLWPIKLRNVSYVQRILNSNDEVLVYLTKKAVIAGVVEVSGELRVLQESLIFQEEVYEAVIPMRVKKILTVQERVDIRRLRNELELTYKGGERWGIRMQRAVVQLTAADFELLSIKVAQSH